MKFKKWILEGNDCSKCKYCWEVKTSYEYDEWDCGCYIKGEDYDEKACYLINPFKFILGKLAMKKTSYYRNHEYDGFVEFMEEQEKLDNKIHELIMEKILKGYCICWEDSEGKLYKINTSEIVRYNAWEVRHNYEDFAHPYKYKKLSTEWAELIKKTFKVLFNRTIGRIKPYVCK